MSNQRQLQKGRSMSSVFGLFGAVISTVLLLGVSPAIAQDDNSRPIRMVVPYPAGGAADFLARTLAEKVGANLKQNVIVDNMPGANGTIATQMVVNAPADGLTLLFAVPGVVVFNSFTRKQLPYDPQTQLTPVAMLAATQFALIANVKAPFNSVRELVDYAKSHPGKLTYGSPGIGSHPHIAMEEFKAVAGIDLLHVPYQGGAPAMRDLLGGNIDLKFDGVVSVPPQVRAGRVKALAVSGAARTSILADVPTVAEFYPGFDSATWYGIFVPSDVQTAKVVRLRNAFFAAVDDSVVQKRMADNGISPIGKSVSAEQFQAILKSEFVRYGKVIKSIGIEPQ